MKLENKVTVQLQSFQPDSIDSFQEDKYILLHNKKLLQQQQPLIQKHSIDRDHKCSWGHICLQLLFDQNIQSNIDSFQEDIDILRNLLIQSNQHNICSWDHKCIPVLLCQNNQDSSYSWVHIDSQRILLQIENNQSSIYSWVHRYILVLLCQSNQDNIDSWVRIDIHQILPDHLSNTTASLRRE